MSACRAYTGGMTDTLYRMGLESPVGFWSLTTTETQALSLDYEGDCLSADMRVEPETKLEMRLACMLSRYFKGDRVDFSPVPIVFPTSSRFLAEMMRVLKEVPYGEVHHYQWLAEAMGNRKAAQAVGGALGRNPLPIIVPCHRIIAKNGSLGGFMRGASEGSRIKTFLLELEGVCLGQTPLRRPASR